MNKNSVNQRPSSRRYFIKASVSKVVFSALTIACPSIIRAENVSVTKAEHVVKTLSKALRSIGSAACMLAADKFEASHKNRSQVSFHLRDAGLTTSDVRIIADSLSSLPEKAGATLVSVSLSYNSKLGDSGAGILVRSLPSTVHEIGLVGCGMSDAGAEEVLKWASNASNLRMLCIEDNRLSESMKVKFRELARQRAGLMLVV